MKILKSFERFAKGTSDITFMDIVGEFDDFDVKFIDLSNERLIDMYYLDENFPNLIDIDCSRNRLTNLNDIQDIIKLEMLNCAANEITSLKGIEYLKKLKVLFFNVNHITSLDDIKNLINLKKLDCSRNEITSLKCIENFTKLTNLYCDNNPIDWVDYVDKQGRTYYTKLPKSLEYLSSDKFNTIREYLEFMDQNQPSGISRKFNF